MNVLEYDFIYSSKICLSLISFFKNKKWKLNKRVYVRNALGLNDPFLRMNMRSLSSSSPATVTKLALSIQPSSSFLTLNPFFFYNFKSNKHNKPPFFSIRNCTSSSSISAKPSSQLRKNHPANSDSDPKLTALRRLFSKPDVSIDAYIIPSQDAHQSEFIAQSYARRKYISGFTGSNGTAVVTNDKAALWTDGRYFLQVLFLKHWHLTQSY